MPDDAPNPKTPAASAATLDQAIRQVQTPFGGAPDLRERERAAATLLAHADQAHPRLPALLESGQAANPYALIEVLPRFGRPESVPVLAALLTTGPARLSQAARQALARHPLAQARAALVDGLQAERAETRIAAADALITRADPSVCPALHTALNQDDAIVRYHIVQAAGHLGLPGPGPPWANLAHPRHRQGYSGSGKKLMQGKS